MQPAARAGFVTATVFVATTLATTGLTTTAFATTAFATTGLATTGLATTGLGAPTPRAAGHADELDITPETARPGESITVAGGCATGDRYVHITGAARGRGQVAGGRFTVRARVMRDRPGEHHIAARCRASGRVREDMLRVVSRDRREDAAVPLGWAETGGGGTREPGLPWMLAGMAMVGAAAVISGTAVFRSRTGRDRL